MSDLRFVGELGVNSSCLPQGQGPEGCTHRAGVPFLTYLGTRTSNDKDFHLSSLTQPLLSPGGPGLGIAKCCQDWDQHPWDLPCSPDSERLFCLPTYKAQSKG